MSLILPNRFRILPQSSNIADAVHQKMCSNLLKNIPDVKSRLQIFSDDMLLRFNEDKDLSEEVAKGYYYFTVLFDGEHVTNFDTNESPQTVELRIFIKLQGKLDSGKLHKDIQGYELGNEKRRLEEKEHQEAIDRIDFSGATKEEKLINHAVAEALREENNKPLRIQKKK